MDELNISGAASFVMMCVSVFTLARTIQTSKQSNREKEIRENYKLDAISQSVEELNSLLHTLMDGYTSNEKRISLLERNDTRQDKRIGELEERLRHILDEILPNIGR